MLGYDFSGVLAHGRTAFDNRILGGERSKVRFSRDSVVRSLSRLYYVYRLVQMERDLGA